MFGLLDRDMHYIEKAYRYSRKRTIFEKERMNKI